MREQPPLLEHVADASTVFPDEDSPVRVDQRHSVDDNPAAARPDQAANDVDERSLSRARSAEECGQPPFGHELRLQGEGSQAVRNVDLQAHSVQDFWPTLRAINSEMMSAAIAIAMDTSVSRMAPASPPGICVNV